MLGTIDIVYACTYWFIQRDVHPTRVMKAVAAGVLGPSAYARGDAVAALGLGLHFFIATMVVLTYYAVSRYLKVLVRLPLVFGPLYGVAVFFVMERVVVPLSRAPLPKTFNWNYFWWSLAVHSLLLGTTAALSARWASR